LGPPSFVPACPGLVPLIRGTGKLLHLDGLRLFLLLVPQFFENFS
jgi:hypothetical protein